MMIPGILLMAAGGFLIFKGVEHYDSKQRARGRRRLNRILTDFGGGSFKDGVEAAVSEKVHGLLSMVLVMVGLACIFHGCEKLSGDGAESSHEEVSVPVEDRTE